MSDNAKVVDAPSNEVSEFQVPAGYVLVPQDAYDLLVANSRGPNRGGPEIPLYLRVLKPLHIGDIKAQVSPGEVIEWIPYKSLTIRGRKFNQLGSFLSVWNKTFPGTETIKNPHYNAKHPKFFEVENPEDLDKAFGRRTFSGSAASMVSEEDRIIAEQSVRSSPENRDATASNARADGVTFAEGLPPRGSEARKQLIANSPVERLSAGRTAAAAIEQDENMSVEDFEVSVQTDDQRTVATIDGPTAEAEELAPITAKREKVRR